MIFHIVKCPALREAERVNEPFWFLIGTFAAGQGVGIAVDVGGDCEVFMVHLWKMLFVANVILNLNGLIETVKQSSS